MLLCYVFVWCGMLGFCLYLEVFKVLLFVVEVVVLSFSLLFLVFSSCFISTFRLVIYVFVNECSESIKCVWNFDNVDIF